MQSTGSSPLVIPPADDSDTDRRSVGTLFHWARTLPCSQPDLSSSRCGQKPRLRARCHGENDDILYFFQWCAASSSIALGTPEAGTLHVNMDVVRTRFAQFTSATDASASSTRRRAKALLFEQFLVSRAGSQRVQTAQPSDIFEILCWLDFCGPRRRTPVHALHCTAVGTSTLGSCSTMAGDCALRYAHEFLRANYVSKLSVFYERDLGIVSDLRDNVGTGNPERSALVTSYMAFSREEQNKAGVTVKKAPALLSSHLRALVVPMRARL